MFEFLIFFFNLSRANLWPRMWSILENVLCALEKKVIYLFIYLFIYIGEIPLGYQLGRTGPMYHLKLVFPC